MSAPLLTPSHAYLHWSFCTDDACTFHISSKNDTGYWPKAYKPPKLLRKEANLSENKENIPPNDEEKHSEHNEHQEAKRDAVMVEHDTNSSK